MARAQAVSPQVESGNVYLPHPLIAPWVDSFLDECERSLTPVTTISASLLVR